MALSQFEIIQSLGEALTWFQKELAWGVHPGELKHLTGRIGELYTAMFTYGQMATEVNQEGYDVVSATGERISVKTITSSHKADFTISTFDKVDRVVVLRINVEDLAIEILLDKPAEEARLLMREGASKLVYPTRSRERLARPLEEMVVLRQEAYKQSIIKQYENGTIQVLHDGVEEKVAKPFLREIANELQVTITNAAGTPKNTRQLGDHILRKLEELRGNDAPKD